MQVFVFEYLTGGGALDGPAGPATGDSLFCEGMSMLQALVADLAAVSEVDVTVQLDSRLQSAVLAECNALFVSSTSEEVDTFRRLAAAADVTVVIAPEFDDLLLRRCQIVEEVGGRLLGPASGTVALLADKLATAGRLSDAGVSTPDTQPLDEVLASPPVARFPAVLKPRFGAGSQDVRLVDDLPGFAHHGQIDWLLQEYCRGHPVSVAALCGPRQIELSPAVTQLLSDDGHFRYLGGQLPVSDEYEKRAHRLVQAAMDCLPRLTGYVGFDLVLGDDTRGNEDVIIEINPRLTTSYVGLRKASQQNLAAVMIDIAAGKSAELSFSGEPTKFSPDGSLSNTEH